MAILYAADMTEAGDWIAAIHRLAPDLPIRLWPDWGDAADIAFVLVAARPPGDLSVFPHLKAIQSTWAGVNHLLKSEGLPPGVPIARMVDRDLTTGMSEYVAFHALDLLRDGPALRAAQKERRWLALEQRLPAALTVGVMGLGELGRDAAMKLLRIGFRVKGWSRTGKALPGVATFAGRAALPDFLKDLDLLAVLLPLTAATAGILDARLFAAMKPGTVLLNAARGGHLIEADLLAALAQGGIARAILDVFATEPLPPDHPFWRHPRISVSPHVAAITRPGAGAADIVENYRRALAGEPLLHQVDPARGY